MTMRGKELADNLSDFLKRRMKLITADECRVIRKANLDALYEQHQASFQKAFRYIEEQFCNFVHQEEATEYLIGYAIRKNIISQVTNVISDFKVWILFLDYCKTKFENCGYKCEIEEIERRFLRITWEEN